MYTYICVCVCVYVYVNMHTCLYIYGYIYIYIYIYIYEAYSSFEGVSSDHRTVTVKIQLSLRRNAARTTTTVYYDWSLLTIGLLEITLRNKFNALQEI